MAQDLSWSFNLMILFMKHILTIICLLLSVCLWGQNLTPKKVGKLWGFANENDSMVIPAKYSAVGDFTYQYYTWVNIGGKGNDDELPFGGKWGVIDVHGNEVCPVNYDYVDYCTSDLVAVNLGGVMNKKTMVIDGGLWGFVDLKTGQVCVPVEYTQVSAFINSDVAWMQKGGTLKKKILYEDVKNEKGKVVGHKRLFHVFNDFNLLKAFERFYLTGAWGLVAKDGTTLTPFDYSCGGNFKNGTCAINKSGHYGLMDMTGKELIPCQYEDISECYDEGVVWVWEESSSGKNKIGLLSKNGTKLSEMKYESVGNFVDSVAWFVINEKIGLIDCNGKELRPATFQKVGEFNHNLAFCSTDGVTFGIIDNKGKQILPEQYSNMAAKFGEGSPFVFNNGTNFISWVKQGSDSYSWIDQNGNIIISNAKIEYTLFDVIPNELWDY